MMTQQRTRTICNPNLIAICERLEKIQRSNQIANCGILSIQWIRETVQIEVKTVRPNFHMNISEQFTIRECMRPSFEVSVNMDKKNDVNEDDYLRKSEVSCSKTTFRLQP